MKCRALVSVLVLGCIAAAAYAQGATKGDPALSKQLDRLGVRYKITDSGNYSMTYDLDGGRSQTVYIMGKTVKYGNTEIRELWSRAGTFDDVPSAEVMQKLLEESGEKEIGFWSIEKGDDGYIVYFSVKVPVYIRDSDLAALLELTANVADQKEAELFNSDDE